MYVTNTYIHTIIICYRRGFLFPIPRAAKPTAAREGGSIYATGGEGAAPAMGYWLRTPSGINKNNA